MTARVRLSAAVAAPALYAYLTDPLRRPEWQSSLRRVADVRGGGETGSSWVDVTVTGARPRMRVVADDAPRSWTERGTWRGLGATLQLDFDPVDDAHCVLTATFRIDGDGVWRVPAAVLQRLAGPAVAADLRRAVVLARTPEPTVTDAARTSRIVGSNTPERRPSPMHTVVHLVRHGQVHNPDGILYGRLPGYGLSEIGRAMAQRLGEHFADAPLTHLRCSPLQRAQETMAPIAANHGHLEVVTDERVIEAANVFEGRNFGRFNQVLLLPQNLWQLRNPLQPSWGEPYPSIVARVREAMRDAAAAAGDGGQALIVMHELPIWISRLAAEGRRLVHDPRRRECRLASVTSFTFDGDRIVGVEYHEPAADLVPAKKSKVLFRPGS